MHHTKTTTTGTGARLLAKLNRHKPQSTATVTKSIATPRTSSASPARASLFGPLIANSHDDMVKAARLAKAAQIATAGKKPVTLVVRPPLMRAPGEGAPFEAGLNLDDPRHVHAAQLRASASAHTSLLAAIKAVHNATPSRHPSTAPEAL